VTYGTEVGSYFLSLNQLLYYFGAYMKTYSILLLLTLLLFNTNLNSKTLYGWGYDSEYQIIEGIHTPKLIDDKLKFKMITTSYDHSLGLKSDGTLWAWGDNYYGQLGDGTDTIRLTPVQIGVEKDWAYITCDREVSFGIKKNGTL
jgi:alpha-tubulin suppressor-like RCC1 family protein